MNRNLRIVSIIILSLLFIGIISFNLQLIKGKETKKLTPPGKSSQNRSNELTFLPFTKNDRDSMKKGHMLTREYQMKVFSKSFINRTEGVAYINEVLADVFDIPILRESGNATIRFQYIMDTDNCKKAFNPRIRRYYSVIKDGNVTLDIKSSTYGTEGPEKIISQGGWQIFDDFKEGSLQKFEWDIHPCKIKYSLESRVNIPIDMRMLTCGDLAKIYKRVDAAVNDDNRDNEFTWNSLFSGWWYELEYRGFLWDGITEFKTALTLEYNTKEDAEIGMTKPINAAEWSIRVWSTNHGTGQWPLETLKTLNHRYFEALEALGSPDFPCTGEFNSLQVLEL